MLEIKEMKNHKFQLNGELNLSTLEEFYAFLVDHLKKKTKMTFDFSGLATIDTAAIQLLISFKKSLDKGVSLTIVNVNETIIKTMKLIGMKEYFLPKG